MKKSTFQRNRELISLCLRLARAHQQKFERCTIEGIVTEALMTAPKAHYIEYDRAAQILHMAGRIGFRRLTCNELQKERWIELSDQVEEAMNGPRRLPFAPALAYVLTFRHPSRYYISLSTARKIVAPFLYKTVAVDGRA